MSLFWISWYQPTEDHRPIAYPPNKAILGWWNTGTRDDGAKTLCALVSSETDKTAKNAIKHDWPEAEEWRFVSDKENTLLNDRFPLSDWMKPRIEAYKSI